ncbi:MAG TPA: hypothetical protein VJ996_01150 [Solirubrobacteraceae bacterium]|nr:hypothetical protein [Solirubrobacteraceae bacterium]
MVNPFRYSSPVDPRDMIDRKRELTELLDLAEGAHNTRLVAPRRYGKSSLLHAVQEEAEKLGMVPVYVNFFGVVTAGDIADRIEVAYTEQLSGPLARWFDGVRATFRVGGGPIPASAEVSVDARAQQPLLERLALPRRLFEKQGKRCLVAFDEFQDALTAHERIDAVIRSEIERHGDAASYVFAGSHVGMMRELFTDKRRAFYAQARKIDLHPLDPGDVAAFVAMRFQESGKSVGEALTPLLELTAGHPQRSMLLAHFVWEETPARGEASGRTWTIALARVLEIEAAEELRGAWTALSSGERRALLAISGGQPPYARSTQRQVGGSRGGGMEHAIRSLLDTGELVEDQGAPTGYRVVDPLLAHWVRAGRHSS